MTGPLISTGAVQADPEALLKAANILRTQAADLDRSSKRYLRNLEVRDCGTDGISKWATAAFNEKIRPIGESVTQLIALFDEASSALIETAQSYGATDQQIQASMVTLDHGLTFQQQVQQKAGMHPVGQTPVRHAR